MTVFVILQSEEARPGCQTSTLGARPAAGHLAGRYGLTSAVAG